MVAQHWLLLRTEMMLAGETHLAADGWQRCPCIGLLGCLQRLPAGASLCCLRCCCSRLCLPGLQHRLAHTDVAADGRPAYSYATCQKLCLKIAERSLLILQWSAASGLAHTCADDSLEHCSTAHSAARVYKAHLLLPGCPGGLRLPLRLDLSLHTSQMRDISRCCPWVTCCTCQDAARHCNGFGQGVS